MTTFAHDAVHFRKALRQCLGWVDLVLNPVGFFLQSVCVHMADVVWIVVEGRHRREVVITLQQETLVVKVGETNRTIDLLHAFGFAPFSNFVQESKAHLFIVNKVNPAEANVLHAPTCVRCMVNETCDTSYDTSIAICHV